jgi:hypothetical protein
LSASLDLAGGIVTLAADSVNYYFTITDSVGGGELIMEAGSSIVFDDASGAGFLSTSEDFTLTINGNSTSGCEIRSASASATYRWTWPPLTISATITRCTFRQYATPFSAPSAWALNNCIFDYEIPTTSPYSFTAWFPHRASLEHLVGYDEGGSPTYDVSAVVECYLNYKLQNVLGPDGNDVTSDSYLLIDGAVTVAPYDMITLPDGTKRPVKNVASSNMPTGQTVLKVVYL